MNRGALVTVLRWEFFAAAAATFAFAFQYTLYWRWWDNMVGRSLIVQDLLTTAGFILVAIWLRGISFAPGAPLWLIFGILGTLPPALLWRMLVLRVLHGRWLPRWLLAGVPQWVQRAREFLRGQWPGRSD